MLSTRETGKLSAWSRFGVFIMAPAERARYAAARTLAFGGDEKFASERGSDQPRSPSQAEGMMALEREKRKELGASEGFSPTKAQRS